MKKKISYLLFTALLCCMGTISFCQNGSSVPCSELPQLSFPATAVNDFANIINDPTKQKIERDVTIYEDSTKIAIVTATVQTLNGRDHDDYATDLFRCWGIGSKATNSGILIFIAVDERKIVIRTGYGMESILPDITCKEIIDNYMTPQFKAGDYSKGIDAAVYRIIEILGTMSWEERQQRIEDEKLAKEKEAEELKDTLLNILLGAALVVLLFFGIRAITKHIAKNKLRKQIDGFVDKIRFEILRAQTAINDSIGSYKDMPVWARKEAENHRAEAYGVLTNAQEAITNAAKKKKDDPEKSMRDIQKAHQWIEKSHANFSKIEKNLKEKVTKLATEAPLRLTSAKDVVLKNLDVLSVYTQKGYKLLQIISEHQNFKTILGQYEANIGDNNSHPDVYTQAEIIKTKSSESLGLVSTILHKQKVVDTTIDTLIAGGKEQYRAALKVLDLFEHYEKNYPESVWQKEEVLLKKMISRMNPERLDTLRTEIIQLNSMEKQQFTTAAMKYDELKKQIQEIKDLCITVQNISTVQQKSKENFPLTYAAADGLVQQALQKVKDSDVESSTRTIAKNAQQKLSEAKIQSSASILDWVLLIALITSASDLASNAIRKAKSDIDDAERARKRKRDEDEAKRRRDSESRNSYSPSSYNSSYSGSSFGGFGGGSTGGGGASGGW